MRRRLLALPALLPLLLAACSVFEPEYAGVVVRFREVAPLLRERLVVTIADGGTIWYLEGTDLAAGADGWLASREMRIRPGGRATVHVALRGEGSEPASSGEITLPLPAEARWRLDIFPSSGESSVHCDGCDGIVRFPIRARFRPSAQDWLYLRWEGLDTAPGADRASARPILTSTSQEHR